MIGLPVGVAAALLILLAALWRKPAVFNLIAQATTAYKSNGVNPAINHVKGDQDTNNTTKTQENHDSNNKARTTEINARNRL
jgi:hypothetical protein